MLHISLGARSTLQHPPLTSCNTVPVHDRTPAAATELAAVDSGHPDPNGLRQEPRVVLSFTPVASAVHLVAETTKTTIAAALLVAAGQNSGELTWPS